MRRLLIAFIGAVALAAALVIPAPVAAAPNRSYRWQQNPIEVWDATPFPELVDTVVFNWNVSGLRIVVTRRLTTCESIPQGVIQICAGHYGTTGSLASWAFPNITGGRRVIKSAEVGINLDYSVWTEVGVGFDQMRQYLMCHEFGGALGEIEARWPAYLPDGSLDTYHYGCMNLQYQGPLPSPYDIDFLLDIYGP